MNKERKLEKANDGGRERERYWGNDCQVPMKPKNPKNRIKV